MNKEASGQIVQYAIEYIKQIFFSINEKIITKEKQEKVAVEINAKEAINIENQYYVLSLRARFFYNDDPEKQELAAIEVENVFHVENLKSYLSEENKLLLPGDLLVSLVSMSISHTRALFTKSLAGTALQEVIMPIVNPMEVAKYLFPKNFSESSKKEVVN